MGNRELLPCLPLLPDSECVEASQKENDDGNDWRLDAERKYCGRYGGLQLDVDGDGHLCEEEEGCEQQECVLGFDGQRSGKPREQEENAREHFADFAGEDGLMWEVTLLNLNIKPAVEWLEEFEDSEEEHHDSKEQRQGLDEAIRHGTSPGSNFLDFQVRGQHVFEVGAADRHFAGAIPASPGKVISSGDDCV
jgi:hypothetical protein